MSTIKRHIPTAARLFLALVFTVMGLNGFFQFLPMPPQPARALAFFVGLAGSGYFLPLLKATEVIVGILLLTNRFVPLALAVIAPVIVNIVAFHLFLAPAGLGLPLGLLAAELIAAWSYRTAFAPMLHARTTTAQASSPVSAMVGAVGARQRAA